MVGVIYLTFSFLFSLFILYVCDVICILVTFFNSYSFLDSTFIPIIRTILPIICALLAVGFYTLLERKILGYIQNRKGPNKVRFMGILQPFSDAGKLFTKEYVIPTYSNGLVFFCSPFLVLSVRLLL